MTLKPLDILHKIACRMYGYSGLDGAGAIEELMTVHQNDFSVAITDDLHRSELWFLARCGHGDTFHFRVERYEQGKSLAADLLHFLRGEQLDRAPFNSTRFDDSPKLYLFIHVRHTPVRRLGTWGSHEVVRIGSMN